jgi:ElaB/YqjD/DUF883 family membrane-anchored ribosome-binding protein
MPANSVNKASDETRAAIDDVSAAAERSIQDLARRAERAIHDGIESLRTQSRGYVGSAEEQFDVAQRYVTERVHERPMTATLAALGVGVLVGFLLSGRRN